MSDERLVILVPSGVADEKTEYWRNFVFRVQQAIERDGLTCRILESRGAEPQVIIGASPRNVPRVRSGQR